MSTNSESAVGNGNGRAKKVHTFLTHFFPDLDELLTFWMLRNLRPDLCCKEVKIRFWEGTDKQLSEALQDPGVLACGIGGGEFDEHPSATTLAKEGECAATLAAKQFGLGDNAELGKLLSYVAGQDIRAQGTLFDLAAGVRAIYDLDEDPMVAIRWAMKAFEAFYAKEEQFTKALAEFRVHSKKREISIGGGKNIVIASIESDNRSANRCSRFLGIDILVQRQVGGNVQIYTNKKAELPPLDDVARVLRMAEQWEKKRVLTTDWRELAQEGTVPGAEEWYYFLRGNMLLNGSLKVANRPTMLSLEQIVRAVEIGLNPDLFEPNRFRSCKQGRCTSSSASPCRWYDFGLTRCRKIRFEERLKREAETAKK